MGNIAVFIINQVALLLCKQAMDRQKVHKTYRILTLIFTDISYIIRQYVFSKCFLILTAYDEAPTLRAEV